MLWTIAMVGFVSSKPNPTDFRARIERSPIDVASFIKRRIACNHWHGEVFPHGFAPRQHEVRHTLKRLHCKAIESDARRLRQKYRRDPEVITLLTQTEQMLPDD
jgi:hypothetical protein